MIVIKRYTQKMYNEDDGSKQNTQNNTHKNTPPPRYKRIVLLDFSLTVKAATLIFISGRGSAISSDKEGKSGYIYNLVKT